MSGTNILIILIYLLDLLVIAIAVVIAGICIYSIFESLNDHFGHWRK